MRPTFPSCILSKDALQVAKVQAMSALRSRLEADFLEGLPGKSVLQLREHLTAKAAALREQAAALISEPAPEQVPSRAFTFAERQSVSAFWMFVC